MSLPTRLLKTLLWLQFSGSRDRSIDSQRARQDKLTGFARLPADIRCESVNLGSLSAEWVTGAEAVQGAVLYLHGGGYVMGSVNTHRELVSRIARAASIKVLALNYRLAPEHPYPAALEDTISAYHWLLDQGYDPAQVLFAGDSAGGGLAFAAMVALRDAGEILPAGAIGISPWTDLTLSGESIQSKADVECILKEEHLGRWAKWYAGDHDAKLPLISPRYADLSGLPPLLIQVGGDEILLDDALNLAKAAERAGVDVQLEVWEEMFHVFHMFSFLPQAKKAVKSMVNFVKCRVGSPNSRVL